jgi:hypothetical protein
VRVRSERTAASSTDLMASLKGLLKPLWPGEKAKPQ